MRGVLAAGVEEGAVTWFLCSSLTPGCLAAGFRRGEGRNRRFEEGAIPPEREMEQGRDPWPCAGSVALARFVPKSLAELLNPGLPAGLCAACPAPALLLRGGGHPSIPPRPDPSVPWRRR